MKKCPKCGYERSTGDDYLFPKEECPSCGVIYDKVVQKKGGEDELSICQICGKEISVLAEECPYCISQKVKVDKIKIEDSENIEAGVSSFAKPMVKELDSYNEYLSGPPLLSIIPDAKCFSKKYQDAIIRKIRYRKINNCPDDLKIIIKPTLLSEFKEKVKIHEMFSETKNSIASYLEEKSFKKYKIVNITRSSTDRVSEGIFAYEFTDNLDLNLIRVPAKPITLFYYHNKTFKDAFEKKGLTLEEQIMLYDASLESDAIKIKSSEIKDFNFFGTELMQSTISSIGGGVNVGGAIIGELLLGTTGGLLLGREKLKVTTSHKVKDTRKVQVILNDSTDIEFLGIDIYFDFNRLMGRVKSKETKNENNAKLKDHNFEAIKKFKELLDLGIITQDEFNQKKKQFLELDVDTTDR